MWRCDVRVLLIQTNRTGCPRFCQVPVNMLRVQKLVLKDSDGRRASRASNLRVRWQSDPDPVPSFQCGSKPAVGSPSVLQCLPRFIVRPVHVQFSVSPGQSTMSCAHVCPQIGVRQAGDESRPVPSAPIGAIWLYTVSPEFTPASGRNRDWQCGPPGCQTRRRGVVTWFQYCHGVQNVHARQWSLRGKTQKKKFWRGEARQESR